MPVHAAATHGPGLCGWRHEHAAHVSELESCLLASTHTAAGSPGAADTALCVQLVLALARRWHMGCSRIAAGGSDWSGVE